MVEPERQSLEGTGSANPAKSRAPESGLKPRDLFCLEDGCEGILIPKNHSTGLYQCLECHTIYTRQELRREIEEIYK